MESRSHSIVNVTSNNILTNIRSTAGGIIAYDNSNSKNVLIGGDLLFFNLLTKKEQTYVINRSIIAFQKQINNFPFSGKEKATFCSSIISGDQLYIVRSPSSLLFFCAVTRNGEVAVEMIKQPKQGEMLTLLQNVSVTSYTASVGYEAFLIQVTDTKGRNINSIKNELMTILNLSNLASKQSLTAIQQATTKLRFAMMITKIQTHDKSTKWMGMFEGFNEIGVGIGNVYADMLNRMTFFIFDCKQIIKHLEVFLTDFWNLSVLQSSVKKNGIGFIHHFSNKKVMIGKVEYQLPSHVVKILQYLQAQNKLDAENRNSAVFKVKKIKSIIAEGIPSILDTLQKKMLTIDDIPALKEPRDKFYAALYLSLNGVESCELNVQQFESVFYNNHMASLFRLEKNQELLFEKINQSAPKRR